MDSFGGVTDGLLVESADNTVPPVTKTDTFLLPKDWPRTLSRLEPTASRKARLALVTKGGL